MAERLFKKVDPDEWKKHYILGKWGGHVQYQCLDCPWDCLDDEALYQEHWNVAHKPPEVKSTILVADKSGNEVK